MSRPMTRREKQAAETRKDILDAAQREYGFAAQYQAKVLGGVWEPRYGRPAASGRPPRRHRTNWQAAMHPG